MSIAVLRTYIAKREEEHDAYLNKKGKSTKKVPEGSHSASVIVDESTTQDAAANGGTEVKENRETEVQKNQSVGEANSISEGYSSKRPQELKAPRVLEVSQCFLFSFHK